MKYVVEVKKKVSMTHEKFKAFVFDVIKFIIEGHDDFFRCVPRIKVIRYYAPLKHN